MTMLFASDDELIRMQKAVREGAPRHRRHSTPDLTREQRSEMVEDMRELREHQRWREFAWLLFVAPVLIAILTALAQWIVLRFLAPGAPAP